MQYKLTQNYRRYKAAYVAKENHTPAARVCRHGAIQQSRDRQHYSHIRRYHHELSFLFYLR
jgi:hypothetical protein